MIIITVWKQAIHPKKWRENFPAIKIALLFMAQMWIPHICCFTVMLSRCSKYRELCRTFLVMVQEKIHCSSVMERSIMCGTVHIRRYNVKFHRKVQGRNSTPEQGLGSLSCIGAIITSSKTVLIPLYQRIITVIQHRNDPV